MRYARWVLSNDQQAVDKTWKTRLVGWGHSHEEMQRVVQKDH